MGSLLMVGCASGVKLPTLSVKCGWLFIKAWCQFPPGLPHLVQLQASVCLSCVYCDLLLGSEGGTFVGHVKRLFNKENAKVFNPSWAGWVVSKCARFMWTSSLSCPTLAMSFSCPQWSNCLHWQLRITQKGWGR